MTLPAAAKKVISAAESMGFTVTSEPFEFIKDAVLWKSTGDGHNEGDVRTPEQRLEGWHVVGYRTDSRLAFEAFYAGGFHSARVLDPVGRYRELYVDYSYSEKAAKDFGYGVPHAAKLSARRDRDYNDGEQIRQFDWRYSAANEFYAWIDEWLKLLKSEHPPISPKPRAPRKTKAEIAEEAAAEREATILSGGEWSGGE